MAGLHTAGGRGLNHELVAGTEPVGWRPCGLRGPCADAAAGRPHVQRHRRAAGGTARSKHNRQGHRRTRPQRAEATAVAPRLAQVVYEDADRLHRLGRLAGDNARIAAAPARWRNHARKRRTLPPPAGRRKRRQDTQSLGAGNPQTASEPEFAHRRRPSSVAAFTSAKATPRAGSRLKTCDRPARPVSMGAQGMAPASILDHPRMRVDARPSFEPHHAHAPESGGMVLLEETRPATAEPPSQMSCLVSTQGSMPHNVQVRRGTMHVGRSAFKTSRRPA